MSVFLQYSKSLIKGQLVEAREIGRSIHYYGAPETSLQLERHKNLPETGKQFLRAYADSHRRRLTICGHKDYWTDTKRKAAENPRLQKHANIPGLLDYFEALIKPTTLIVLAKMNIEALFGAANTSLKTLFKAARRPI